MPWSTNIELKMSRLFVFILTLVISGLTLAQKDIFNDSSSNSLNTNSLDTVTTPEFLKVEQAYQVDPQINADGTTFLWTIYPEYYLYQHQFKVEARNASKSEMLTLNFEPGKEKFDEFFNKNLMVYYSSTKVTGNLPSIEPPYDLIVSSQGCADAGLCYPPRDQYFPVDENGVIGTESDTPMFKKVSGSNASAATQAPTNNQSTPFLPMVLLGALLGGMILNLMPCVFPVLSLKALSFASSKLNKHHQHMHGWAYTAGVVGSFLVAAVVILSARGAGESLGWGFQLQQPGFVAFMAFLFFVMGLSLSGMFHIGTQWMGAGQSLTTGEGLKSSFFTGVLAALVASPCTAPFMATALGFALTQPAYIALLIFAALGFGMALPFLLLSYIPALSNYLPSPGPWMDVLKQVLAFPLYLTSVWLLWVLSRQTSSDGAMVVLCGAILLVFGIWLTQQAPRSKMVKSVVLGLAGLSFIGTAYTAWTVKDFSASRDTGMWEEYSSARLEELRAEGTPVFVDLTADWCITCKFNERVALNTQKVARFAVTRDIVMLQGDWTNSDPAITSLLAQFGRNGVPLYLMYPADNTKAPEVLPQILTEDIVLTAMERSLL